MAVESVTADTRCFRQTFRREIRSAFRKPIIHWLGWIFPLILFALIGSNFSEGTLLELPVSVVDNDHSTVSRALIRKLDAGSHASVHSREGGLAEAQRRLSSAEDYAMLNIPVNFESDLLAGKQPEIVLYYNALFYGAGLYSTQDFGGLMAELNTQYRPIIATMVGKSVPALPQVSLNYDSLFNASGSFVYYQQFAATIHLLQLFVVTCVIYVLARSKPLIYSRYFLMSMLGKLAPYTLCYTALLMVELGLLIWFSDARVVGNPLYMLLVGFFYVMAAQSIGILLFTFAKDIITAYTLIGILVGIALTFSGLAVPVLSMPLPAQIISDIEPLTHALYAMFDIFLRHASGLSTLYACLLLTLYPLGTLLLVRKRLIARLRRQEVVQ